MTKITWHFNENRIPISEPERVVGITVNSDSYPYDSDIEIIDSILMNLGERTLTVTVN